MPPCVLNCHVEMPESFDTGLLDRIAKVRILVIGDLILDHYIRGTTERTSPEAPVPVVLYQNEEKIPGGAANVARNIAAAGATACCLGAVGGDTEGNELVSRLESLGIDCDGIVRMAGRPTTVKTRIVSQNQQMLRLDREDNSPVAPETQEQVIAFCRAAIPQCQAVIVSDYAKGLLTAHVLEEVIACARSNGVPTLVDPKGRDYARYHGVHALTPNAREAFEATGCPTTDTEGLAAAAAGIRYITACSLVTITRGAQGLALFEGANPPVYVKATAREVFDVTGAGDTFIAYLAMGLAAGLSAEQAARLANAAAGVVVGKSGAATVSATELRAALAPGTLARKLRTPDQLETLGNELRAAGKRIVFTNGCFDFIHAGHVAFLQQARALGTTLVLATNDDAMITKLKGEPRPIIRQNQRESLLAAIEAVDYIVSFSDPTPHQLIRNLKPDILVKGSNYSVAEVEGHEIVEGYGGKIVLLDPMEGISTRDLLSHHKTTHSPSNNPQTP